MIVECQKCGAPLDVVEGQRLVQCAYCGVNSQVRTHRTMTQPVAAQASQPPVWPQPMPQPVHPQPVRASPGVGVVPGLLGALVVVGIGVGFWSSGRGALFVRDVHADAPATVATVTLSTGVPVARALPAVAGGPVHGATLGAYCRGYYPAAPHLSLRVTSPQRVQITTRGNNDLTMALRLPGPAYRCDDDSGQGSNPLLDMTLLPGVYPVWIGSYRENTTPSFILDLQTFEPGLAESATVLAPNLPATLGTLALAGPTSTATRTGIAGGLVNASLLGSSCRGYIPAGPHLTLTTTGYGHVVLSTRATGDLTLVVRDAQGALHCDDDSGGSMQPRVAAMLPAGQHQVWVGTYGAGERTSFDLMVRGEGINATEPLRNELRPEAIPTIATLDLDRESSAQLRGNIAGTVEARRISPGCVGWMMAAPQLRMVTRTPRHVTIAATSSRGLTLMVRGPGGDVVCADEHNGSPNPTLEADIGVGETNVWIGSYSFSASPTRFRVQVTSQAPRVARSVK